MIQTKQTKNQGGFTLIELIVVIAVIGILAAVMLPKYAGFTASAEKSNVLSEAKYVATAVEAMKLDDNRQFTGTKSSTGTTSATLATPEDIMKYVGKNLGGQIVLDTLTTDTDEAGSFTYYRKQDKSGKQYSVHYDTKKSELGTVADAKAQAIDPTEMAD